MLLAFHSHKKAVHGNQLDINKLLILSKLNLHQLLLLVVHQRIFDVDLKGKCNFLKSRL